MSTHPNTPQNPPPEPHPKYQERDGFDWEREDAAMARAQRQQREAGKAWPFPF